MSEKYAIYTGTELTTVSLWVREGDNEYPIYANTRGRSEWYSHDRDVYENTEPSALSETCKAWLAHFHRVTEGKIEDGGDSMFWADTVEADRPDEQPDAWYEVELINAINQPGMTPEQEDLLAWAYSEVDA